MFRIPLAVLMLFPFAASGLAQESAAPFDAPLVTHSARYGLLADFDQDGFEDAVSWWWSTPYYDQVILRGYRNDGTGKLVWTWYTYVDLTDAGLTGGAYFRILPCQLDSDGSTDICIAYANSVSASIRALRSNGLSAPVLVEDYSVTWTGLTSQPELHALMADFTGDGNADLAYTLDGDLKLLEFVPGQSGLTLRSSISPFGSGIIRGLLRIDANGDATPDLVAWRESAIQLVEVQGCQVTATQTYATGTIEKPAAGDIDGDGDEDLVMWNTTTYAVARRTGPATWSIEPHVTGGPAEFLFDVDLDGDLDGVCCSTGSPQIPDNLQTSTFRVSVNDGTGAFAPSIETAWLGSDHLAGIADLDHDGDMDVVAGRCILYSRGPLTQRLHPLLGSQKIERATADIDGDCDPDFTVGMRPMECNLGDGRISPFSASFPAPPPGTQLVGPGWPGDFDGDGDLDLVVTLQAGTTFLSQRLLANLGGAAFADGGDAGPSGVSFNTGPYQPNHPESSLAADADGDGDVDLITIGSAGGNTISRVWWNDGAGVFTSGPQFQGELVQWIGDLDGDGIPDLAGSSFNCTSCDPVGWHEGLGGGAFGPFVTIAPNGGSRFAVADLDADGDLDLANADSRVDVYWNDGGGTFTPQTGLVSLSNSSSGKRVWSTDVDGDGLLDLLATGSNYAANGLIVLERKADNSGWEAPFWQIVFTIGYGNTPPDAVVCDVDGDGDEDFITRRLIRNATHSPPDGGRRRQSAPGTPGAGTPGTGGLVPILGADGPFRLGGGWLRAPDFEPVLAQIPFTLSGTPGEAGTGSWSRSFTVLPGFAGQTRRYVAEIFDPAAAGGVARSNATLLTYGP
jgi:hypothetical protein